MNDLIVVIDSQRCKRQHRIVIRFFEGNVRILKTGVLSSSLKNADIQNSESYNNFKPTELQRIKQMLSESSTVELQRRYFSLADNTFLETSQFQA